MLDHFTESKVNKTTSEASRFNREQVFVLQEYFEEFKELFSERKVLMLCSEALKLSMEIFFLLKAGTVSKSELSSKFW